MLLPRRPADSEKMSRANLINEEEINLRIWLSYNKSTFGSNHNSLRGTVGRNVYSLQETARNPCSTFDPRPIVEFSVVISRTVLDPVPYAKNGVNTLLSGYNHVRTFLRTPMTNVSWRQRFALECWLVLCRLEWTLGTTTARRGIYRHSTAHQRTCQTKGEKNPIRYRFTILQKVRDKTDCDILS